jgi:putative addiction module component (TIGR02574 family)
VGVSLESLGIDQLSIVDRLALIEKIWQSIPAEVQAEEVPAWHREELTRRRAEVDATPGAGKPWREALARFEPQS